MFYLFGESITNAFWSEFVSMFEYKVQWFGRTLEKLGKTFPSSQRCSRCGYKNKAVKDLQ
ncbi:transposase [Shimazuella sp. KC615]|uniref:Transposase n=1 Tax=Shimazuella alba TaxID=2690964 RepID=A0A6I4VVJ7_9BACL|nr:transposase [Shimazuella alba]